MSFENIFSHYGGCLLVLLIVSFAVQKLFILMKSQQFIFAFVSLVFGDVSSKKLLWPRSKNLLPVFSSRILVDSYLTFRSCIHFGFIFVYGVRKWSSFILLCVPVQFFQHHLLKRLSFFHRKFFPPLSKISCPKSRGSISEFSILFH